MLGTPCGDVDGGEEIDHGNRACDLQVGFGRPAARVIGARCQGERGVSAGGRAGASIGPHLADRGFCPPCAVRSMLTTHPPCAGAWREPRARECAALVRATRAHVGMAQAASWGQAVAASRADRQAVSKRRDALAMLVGRSRTYARVVAAAPVKSPSPPRQVDATRHRSPSRQRTGRMNLLRTGPLGARPAPRSRAADPWL